PLGVSASAHPLGLGSHLVVDATGRTAVAGVFAAGNVVDPSHQLLQAAADGARVGAMVAFDLAT
ncbi:MAG: SAM-dependent methyltransferase, partial [Actinomycetota bacterium]